MSDPVTGRPLFREPAPAAGDPPTDAGADATTPDERPPRDGIRNFGRGRQYSPTEYIRRAERLERLGRRCDANGRTCIHNAATRRITVLNLDPRTGEPVDGAEPFDVLSCSRHTKNWTRSAAYKVINIEPLPHVAGQE